jgi:hypothetical protein
MIRIAIDAPVFPHQELVDNRELEYIIEAHPGPQTLRGRMPRPLATSKVDN